jgi:hypothetical protein
MNFKKSKELDEIFTLTSSSFVTIYFSFFGRHGTLDPIWWNDGEQFTALFPIHGE